jgi:hypothetical protein
MKMKREKTLDLLKFPYFKDTNKRGVRALKGGPKTR